MDFTNITFTFAFLAGLASFLSPCVFSLVPAYIGYLGGRSAAYASSGRESRWLALSHGIAFVLGFTMVFISLGLAASAIGGLLYDLRGPLARTGGLVVIVFGIHMTGIYRIPFLEYDLRPQTTLDRRRGYLASFLMGIFFSAGWSPCVGPILGAILTLSLNGGSLTQGALLLSVYSAGLAIPFLVASTQIALVTQLIRRYRKASHYIEVAMGVLLILVGALLFSGRYAQLAGLGSFFGAYDELSLGRVLLILLAGLIVLGIIPAVIAYRKGRNFFDWWFFGASLFPIALVMAIRIKPPLQVESQSATILVNKPEETQPTPGA